MNIYNIQCFEGIFAEIQVEQQKFFELRVVFFAKILHAKYVLLY